MNRREIPSLREPTVGMTVLWRGTMKKNQIFGMIVLWRGTMKKNQIWARRVDRADMGRSVLRPYTKWVAQRSAASGDCAG
jgi:hypothetical protein